MRGEIYLEKFFIKDFAKRFRLVPVYQSVLVIPVKVCTTSSLLNSLLVIGEAHLAKFLLLIFFLSFAFFVSIFSTPFFQHILPLFFCKCWPPFLLIKKMPQKVGKTTWNIKTQFELIFSFRRTKSQFYAIFGKIRRKIVKNSWDILSRILKEENLP